MIVKIINGLLFVADWILGQIISVFPISPLNWNIDLPEWAQWMNAFIPFQEMAAVMSAYVSAVLLYYATRTIARWIKAVGS